ncbi:MAG: SigB/SigF/SigG family RNA polymerase sigma factor [Clostridiales bacterium]|nr:SigB/SigF/SigG family RNA polymerase sigma factor [Clostridiales bacterium]
MGDKEAQDTMVKSNMGLVHSVVKHFVGRGYEKEDLTQIGAIGLLKAIRKFDLSYDVRFSTYAVPMIMGEIKRFIRDDGMIKISRSLKETAMRGYRAKERLQKTLNREPTINEISEECGIECEELLEAFDAAAPPNSIYEAVYNNGEKEISLIDTIGGSDPQEEIINRVLIGNILDNLELREKQILILRYFKGKTQSEIAKLMGVSQVQISRIEKRVIKRIREQYQSG